MDIKKRPAGRLSAFVLSLLLIVTSVIYVFMQPASAAENDAAAEKLKATFAFEGFTGQKNISDGNNSTFATGSKNSTVAVMADKNISFIYISYNHAPGEWKLSSGSKQADCGRDGFIHEYVDVKSALGDVNIISLNYPSGAEIESVAVYGEGKIPDDVQVWQPPCEKADILLLSAHTDDDQLYFAGLIPYYVTVRGAAVQVAYFTEHLKENYRWHERLNGLWTAGMRNYPVISSFPDAYSSSAAGAYTNFKNAGFSEDQVVSWVSEQLRRFKPQVTVTHDFKGEYGHGQHMAAVDAMTKAVPMAADKSKTLGGYEPFEVLKSYVHVYDKNKIVIDAYDTPFEELGGLTPFAVSQKAFLCHKSQLKWTDLTRWMFGINYPQTYPESIKITKASQITETPPANFGLYYRSDSVPADAACNDLLENITLYSELLPPETGTLPSEPITEPETSETSVPSDTDTAPVTDTEDTAPDSSSPEDTDKTDTLPDTTGPVNVDTTDRGENTDRTERDKSRTGTLILGVFLIVAVAIITALAVYIFIDRRRR